eukprot:XP_001694718.1 predicted protein [Chlamydomonas reinhardtii]
MPDKNKLCSPEPGLGPYQVQHLLARQPWERCGGPQVRAELMGTPTGSGDLAEARSSWWRWRPTDDAQCVMRCAGGPEGEGAAEESEDRMAQANDSTVVRVARPGCIGAAGGVRASAVALSVLEGGMLTLVMALCVCAVSKCPGHEDSDCEDRLVSEDDRPSSPASSIGDKMDMHIADRDGFPPADNEPKPKLLCAAETPLGSLADGSLKPAVTAPTCDTNPACPKPDAIDGSDTDALDFTICSCLHASGCPLVIIDHSADEIAPYKPAGSGAYRLMFQTFTKHWAGVQQAWDTIQALKARATNRLQQALRCRFDMTQIGSDLVLEYLAQTVSRAARSLNRDSARVCDAMCRRPPPPRQCGAGQVQYLLARQPWERFGGPQEALSPTLAAWDWVFKIRAAGGSVAGGRVRAALLQAMRPGTGPEGEGAAEESEGQAQYLLAWQPWERFGGPQEAVPPTLAACGAGQVQYLLAWQPWERFGGPQEAVPPTLAAWDWVFKMRPLAPRQCGAGHAQYLLARQPWERFGGPQEAVPPTLAAWDWVFKMRSVGGGVAGGRVRVVLLQAMRPGTGPEGEGAAEESEDRMAQANDSTVVRVARPGCIGAAGGVRAGTPMPRSSALAVQERACGRGTEARWGQGGGTAHRLELVQECCATRALCLFTASYNQSAMAVSVLEGGMLTLVMALCVCAVSKCPGHEDSDCEDRLVSEDDRPSSPASSIGDKMDMHIADRDGFPPADNEPKPNLLCAAETPLGSPMADGSLKPAVTAPTCDTNPACPKPDAIDGSDTDALDFTICSCLHASGCPLVIIDHSADEIAPYKPAGSGAYRLMFQTFTKHWAGVQQAWDTIQALKARATDRLQQALSCRFDMTQIGSDLVLEYLAQTVCELETQAVWDLQEAGQWEVEWQVRLQAMQLAVREAKAVAEHGWLESVVSVPGFVV